MSMRLVASTMPLATSSQRVMPPKMLKRIAFTSVSDVMISNAKTIQGEALAVEAVKMLQQHKIQGLLVTDDQCRLQGVLNFNDLLQAGVV